MPFDMTRLLLSRTFTKYRVQNGSQQQDEGEREIEVHEHEFEFPSHAVSNSAPGSSANSLQVHVQTLTVDLVVHSSDCRAADPIALNSVVHVTHAAPSRDCLLAIALVS